MRVNAVQVIFCTMGTSTHETFTRLVLTLKQVPRMHHWQKKKFSGDGGTALPKPSPHWEGRYPVPRSNPLFLFIYDSNTDQTALYPSNMPCLVTANTATKMH